ncbi:hypothetical protein ACNOYE_05280 [Nannocystaceae bacterium ST9]
MRPSPARPAALLAALLAACSADPPASPEVLVVHLDERPVLFGRVAEVLESPLTHDTYLRLELLGGEQRWVVLDSRPGATRVGEWIRVRSLAKRSNVWAPAIERDFAVLEYVAPIHSRT